MALAQRLTEAPPAWRWHSSRLATSLLYRRAFARIGEGTVIVRPHRLQGVDRISVGSGCSIFEGAWLACEPGASALSIGDRTYLGHGVHVHALDAVQIGSDCVLADGVFIASADHGQLDRKATYGTGAITIGDRVFIGQRAIVLGGVTIGDNATVGAHAVVTRDVEPGSTVVGAPARSVIGIPTESGF